MTVTTIQSARELRSTRTQVMLLEALSKVADTGERKLFAVSNWNTAMLLAERLKSLGLRDVVDVHAYKVNCAGWSVELVRKGPALRGRRNPFQARPAIAELPVVEIDVIAAAWLHQVEETCQVIIDYRALLGIPDDDHDLSDQLDLMREAVRRKRRSFVVTHTARDELISRGLLEWSQRLVLTPEGADLLFPREEVA